MICLLFCKVESISRVSGAVSRAKATSRFQSNEERSVIAALDFWLECALTRESAKLRKGPPKTSKVEKLDLNKVARELIAEARKALDEVEQEIVEGRASKRKSAP